MKKIPRTPFSCTGSAMAIAIVSIAAIGIITYGLLQWSGTENRLGSSMQSSAITAYNTEALVEYGLAQMAERLKAKPTVTFDEFKTNPLQLPNISLFGNNPLISRISTELIAGPIPDPVTKFIDPTINKNKNDPDKGKTIKSREVLLIGKTEITDSNNLIKSQCCASVFEIRDVPILSYGVFCHEDLILLRPAQPMALSGPVHTNGNLVLVSEGGVYCNGTVTAKGTLQALPPLGDVFFRSGGTDNNPTYTVFNSYNGSNWKDFALSTWNGYLQTQEMGISAIEPFGISISTANQRPNPYHQIIEPSTPANNPQSDPNVEAEKLANKADLVITISVTKRSRQDTKISVNVPYPTSSYATGFFTYDIAIVDPSQEDSPLANKQTFLNTIPSEYSPPPIKDSKLMSATLKYLYNIRNDYNETTVRAYKYIQDTSGPYYRRNASGQISRYRRDEIQIPNLYNRSFPADPNAIIRTQQGCFYNTIAVRQLMDFAFPYFAQCNPALEAPLYTGSNLQEGRKEAVDIYLRSALNHNGCFGSDYYTYFYGANLRPAAPFFDPSIEPNVDTNPPIKLWDARRRKWIHVANLDIGKLKQALDRGSIQNWNGIVYVEYTDTDRTALRIINGQTLPSRGQQGFTIATNNSLYIQGNYNADGNLATGSATTPKNNEVPAAIAADSITVLSNYWDDRLSRCDVTRFATIPNQTDRNTPQDTEIAAAIITGTDVYNSGGINNLVRFLEMWENKKVRIRGSMIALFKNEIAWEPLMMQYVYFPPDREYGFSDLFKNQQFPPGTPVVRSFLKRKKRTININEYNALKNTLSQTLNSSSPNWNTFETSLDTIQRQYQDGAPASPATPSTPTAPAPAPTPSPTPAPAPIVKGARS